jgi:hypothetical protein
MVKKIFFGLCILFCIACTSEIARVKGSEYLRTEPGKPVTYPAGVDRPAQEKTYLIPELAKPNAQQKEAAKAPELLILPPKLAGVDISEDKDEDEEKKDKEEADEEDDEGGFIERAREALISRPAGVRPHPGCVQSLRKLNDCGWIRSFPIRSCIAGCAHPRSVSPRYPAPYLPRIWDCHRLSR